MSNTSLKQRPYGPSVPTLALLLLAVLVLSFPALAQEAEAPDEQAAENRPGQAGVEEGELNFVAGAEGSQGATGEAVKGSAAGEAPKESENAHLGQQEANTEARQEPSKKTGPRLSMAIPAGKEEEILKLFKPMSLGADLPGDYKWHSLSIEAQSLSARLESQSEAQPDLKVSFVALINDRNVVGTSVEVQPDLASLPAGAQQAVAAFRQPMEKKLTPKAWGQLMKPIQHNPQAQAHPDSGPLLLVMALGALVLGTLLGVVLLRKKASRVES